MDSDVMKGKWKQMKGSVQAHWGKLTDSDIDRVEGNRERLVGIIQERYGKEKDEARREVNAYLDSL